MYQYEYSNGRYISVQAKVMVHDARWPLYNCSRTEETSKQLRPAEILLGYIPSYLRTDLALPFLLSMEAVGTFRYWYE